MTAHPQFIALHAILTGESELLAMHEGGLPLHTILRLYPVDEIAYLPYFRRRFSHRAELIRKDPNWALASSGSLYGWEFRKQLERCTDPVGEEFMGDHKWSPQLQALIDDASSQHSDVNWHHSNLGFEARDVLNLATRLSQWHPRRYELMPRRERKDLLTRISSLPGRALANIGAAR